MHKMSNPWQIRGVVLPCEVMGLVLSRQPHKSLPLAIYLLFNQLALTTVAVPNFSMALKLFSLSS